jgi:ribosomal protein L14E/L6E/L27E
MDIKVGSRVRSIAGRDKGVDFIVLGVNGEYVLMADGDLRKVDNPKKKKLKHIQASSDFSAFIADKLEATGKVTNAEVRKALAEISS